MLDLTTKKTILKGLVGSKAYGLDHAGSDEDWIGVFMYPSERFWTRPKGSSDENDKSLTSVSKDPDSVLHELTKTVKLVAGGNPTVTEVLFLSDYAILDDVGQQLIDLGPYLLTADKVRKSYLGYAKAQSDRSLRREDGSYSSDTRKRTQKHTRHLVRLIWQAEQLLSTGSLTVRLTPDQINQCWAMSEWQPAEVAAWFEAKEKVINEIDTVLPQELDWDRINQFLIDVRRNNLSKI